MQVLAIFVPARNVVSVATQVNGASLQIAIPITVLLARRLRCHHEQPNRKTTEG
jgi:hypothetical protein